MKIGTVKEIKPLEYRVGITPDDAKAYVKHGHRVFVEKGAGRHAGFEDSDYARVGVELLKDRQTIFDGRATLELGQREQLCLKAISS
ncbi:MAG: hypothetical protein GY762_11135 [Proteobacteria bacterium]|nr:hypothetical protein [Pseudomonadota bacterium]